jgi:hypothetical protein
MVSLQSSMYLCLLNRHLAVSSVFNFSFQFIIFHLLISVDTQFHIPSCYPLLSPHILFHYPGQFHSVWLFGGHDLGFLTVRFFFQWHVRLLPNLQPGGPVHCIYYLWGKVAKLYLQSPVPILVTFYNPHGLQRDCSFPHSLHGDLNSYIDIISINILIR